MELGFLHARHETLMQAPVSYVLPNRHRVPLPVKILIIA